jgi:hypothetical protein
VNRTLFRGVTAGLLSAALLTAGTVATTALANGAGDSSPAPSASALAMNVREELPARTPIRQSAVRARPKAHVASRQHTRRALVGSPREIARVLVARQGWSSAQFGCLDRLWTRESNWRVSARNASGAYGIPQSLPASKMASMGSDWRTNPITQIRWGLSYIGDAYGTPCTALEHSYRYNYY